MPSLFASGGSPYSNEQGYIAEIDVSTKKIVRSIVTNVAGVGFIGGGGLAYDAKRNRLLAADWSTASVAVYDYKNLTLIKKIELPGADDTESCVMLDEDHALAGSADWFTANMHKIDLTTDAVVQQAQLPSSRGCDWVAVSPDGSAGWYTSETDAIHKFDPRTLTYQGVLTSNDSIGGTNYGVVRLTSGVFAVSRDRYGVVCFDATGTLVRATRLPDLNTPFSITQGDDGIHVFVGDISSGIIYRVDPVTGAGSDVPWLNLALTAQLSGHHSASLTMLQGTPLGLGPLTFGGIDKVGMRYDAALDPVPRGHSHRL